MIMSAASHSASPPASTPAQSAWHALEPDDVFGRLASGRKGLSTAEAARRLDACGPNRLPAGPQRGPVRAFLAQFNNLVIHVLLGASVITAVLGHWVDSGVIFAVVLANALIGFIQEGRAEKAMDAIRGMLAPAASVLRDGERHLIPAEQLVPGDVVLLEAGERVPADLRLFQARNLSIQEAILTGESVPVEKQVGPVYAGATLGDRTCLAFNGTLVAAGQGRGLVYATGAATEIGRISGTLSAVEVLTTPLLRKMAVFARWLTGTILLVAAALLAFGWFVQGHSFPELFMAVVGLSVAAIPEGLPAVLTITLAIGAQAMARRKAIVRRLPAIETLGAVTVICTDKTGTLTRNEMMVATVHAAGDEFLVSGAGYGVEGSVRRDGTVLDRETAPVLTELVEAAVLCNDASLRDEAVEPVVHGDPMEGALLVLGRKLGITEQEARQHWPRTDVIPFDARHRFMATLHHDHEGRGRVLVKGAPEHLLDMCRLQRRADGGEEPLLSASWYQRAMQIADQGQRVLAIAARAAPASQSVLQLDDMRDGLVLLGIVGLIDPPRAEAIEAVAECRSAGIRVKMITGDHALTAAAIARSIGLENHENVVTGAELEEMDDARLAEAVRAADVFARTSPEHKLRLVTALQAQGEIVAMTGDGVNDAPALKRANAGIAMGRKGSEAAKEAAQIVLADDNFATIVAAIREGRTVYDNLKKVISWTLPTSAGEAATIIVALLFGLMLPVTPVQILWVNLITAVTLGIALAFEPTEANTMRRPPRRADAPLLDATLVWHVAVVSVLFLAGVFGMFSHALDRGYPVETARTIAVNTLVVMEIFHLFFIRNIYGTSLTWRAVAGTPIVWFTIITVTAAQFAITYLPPLQAVFDTRAVPLLDGIAIVGVGIALFALIEVEKQLRLRLGAPGTQTP